MREEFIYDDEAFRERLDAVDKSLAALNAQALDRPSRADIDVAEVTNVACAFVRDLPSLWKTFCSTSRSVRTNCLSRRFAPL